MSDIYSGTLLSGSEEALKASCEEFTRIPVDLDRSNEYAAPVRTIQQTIAKPVSVSGPGTFFGKAKRTITFVPSEKPGWRFQRADLPDCLPVRVSADTVWTTGDTVSNIVLRSGPPHNYIRMVEHIIALRLGTEIDNVLIRIDSGDPPLFDRGSLDLVEAIEEAGVRQQPAPVRYVTVKETVTVEEGNGRFLTLSPCDPENPSLDIDCAVNFSTAIGQQRVKFKVNTDNFKEGSIARTNTSWLKMLYCKSIGKIFADIRNLGYTRDNLLIASRKGYVNEPRLLHDGKSLEAVWHRAVLDLIAALALIEEGRFVGKVTSYKAGHRLDVEMIRQLYHNGLLQAVETPAPKQDFPIVMPTVGAKTGT